MSVYQGPSASRWCSSVDLAWAHACHRYRVLVTASYPRDLTGFRCDGIQRRSARRGGKPVGNIHAHTERRGRTSELINIWLLTLISNRHIVPALRYFV